MAAVKGTTSAYARDTAPEMMADGGRGRPGVPRYRARPLNLRQLAIAHAGRVQPVTWRQGTKAATGTLDAAMSSCFLAIRVRPANRDIPRAGDGSLPECWLLAGWPAEADEPGGYWLATLPGTTPIAELVRLAKIRWRI